METWLWAGFAILVLTAVAAAAPHHQRMIEARHIPQRPERRDRGSRDMLRSK